jgi:hypothetical protein
VSLDRAHTLLATAVFLVLAVHVFHRDDVGDFWEHAAVVRELAADPLSPGNPLVATGDPHPMFSPYTLAVALLVRVLGVSPVTALAAAGLFNFVLLAVFLRAFVVRLLGRDATLFALLFLLVLWGHAPWFYSGFLHIDALGYVASYPSTFAIALMLAAFALELDLVSGRASSRKSLASLGGLALVTAVVIVTHPLTAIPTCIGMSALAVDTPRGERTRSVVSIGAAIVAAFVVASAWPYYPLWELLTSGSAAVHETNRWMYPGVRATFVQLYAASFGLPLLVARLRRNPLDALALMFAGLAAVYAYGAMTERWAYGRVVSSAALVLQLAAADWTARQVDDVRRRRRLAFPGAAGLVVLAGLLIAMSVEFLPSFARYVLGRDVVTAERRYAFLDDHVPEDAVVLAKPALRVDVASYVVAAYGGKVVATPVLMLVDDAGERLAEVRRFFQPQTPQAVRREIIAKYDARYILVDGSAGDDDLRWVWELGNVVYNDEDVFLFAVTGG